jgi:hypothetical protein
MPEDEASLAGVLTMAALRFVAGLFLLAAVIALVSDVTRTQLGLAGGPSTSLLKHLADLAPSSLAAAQRAVQNNLHPLVWDPVLKSFLSLPAWASLAAIGLLLAYAGRRRYRVNIYTN